MGVRIKELAAQNERIWNLYTIGPVQRAEVEEPFPFDADLAIKVIKKHFEILE